MCSIIAIAMLIIGGLFGYSLANSSASMAQTAPSVEAIIATPEATPDALSGAGTPEVTQAVVMTPEATACPTEATPTDVAELLQLVRSDMFDPALWTESGGWRNDRTWVSWLSNSLDAVVTVDYLHFDCGATATQIDQYFTPDGFKVIFSGYSASQQSDVCQIGDVKLFEFDLTGTKHNYHADFWVKQISPTRVADFVLTFPTDEPAQEAQYAARLFPTLPSCKAAN